MTTYTVTAKRWAHGWELHIDGVGVTQTRSLSSAEATAREYIAFALDVDDKSTFELSRTGLSGREIAAVLDLTPQRVSQLIRKSSADSAGGARRRSAGGG